ncbi:MAG: hypothetical protein ACP5I1_10110, partial [Candidatus Hinthialibacter sp.]
MKTEKNKRESRRGFFQKTAAGLTAAAVFQHRTVFGSSANSMVQIAIVGTGGRGRYDGRNLVKTGRVKIVALADYFDFQMTDPARDFNVPEDRCYAGVDGYKQVM